MVLPVINGTPMPTPPRSSQSSNARGSNGRAVEPPIGGDNTNSSSRSGLASRQLSTRGGSSRASSRRSTGSKFSVEALDAIESMKQQLDQAVSTGQVVSPPKLLPQFQKPPTTQQHDSPAPSAPPAGVIPSPPSSKKEASNTPLAGGETGKKFALKQKETVTIKPPPELKFGKVGGQVQERDQETEADLLRKNYNKRAPWDKTPAWRPMSRGGAQMLLDIKQQQEERNPSFPSAGGGASSPSTFRQQVSPTNANGLPTHIASATTGEERQLGSTQAAKLITPAQKLAVEFSQRQNQKVKCVSLSPARGDALSPSAGSGDYGLSPSGSIGSPVRSFDTSRLGEEMLLNCLATSDGSALTEDEQELRIEEALEHKNSAAHRPAGKNLLATLKCGETLLASSTRKRQEQSKQFDWHKGLAPSSSSSIGGGGSEAAIGSPTTHFSTTSSVVSPSSNLASSVRGLVFSPSTALYGKHPSPGTIGRGGSDVAVNLSKSYSGSGTSSATVINDDEGSFVFDKNNELDKLSWGLYRRAEKRKAQIAAKIAGGTVVPQGPDSQGVPLNFITTHRRFHENE